jgi:zinc transport system substrate-binding protein
LATKLSLPPGKLVGGGESRSPNTPEIPEEPNRESRYDMWWVNRIVVTVFVVGMLSVGCGQKVPEKATRTGKPLVYTTFYPTQYFAERIGGDLIDVVCPVPADQDVIFWMPDAAAIQAYQKADLILINGAEFCKWVQRVSLPASRVVNTARPFESDFVTFGHAAVHSHGEGGKHAHEGLDGHTWVDPVNAGLQAAEIRKALMKRFPEHKAAFAKGFALLAKDLEALDTTLKAYQAIDKNQPLLASHPAYNYIAKRYGWNIVSLDLFPEEMPSDEAFQGIKDVLKRHPAKHLIWETYPTKAIADRIRKELGLISIEFSPCELLSEDAQNSGTDYMSVMQRNLDNISVVFD